MPARYTKRKRILIFFNSLLKVVFFWVFGVVRIIRRVNDSKISNASVRKTSLVSLSRLLFRSSCLTGLFLVLLTFFPLVISEEFVAAKIDDGLYSLSLSTDPTINMSLVPPPDEVIAIKKHTVSVATASPAGFKLYLSSSSNDANIYRGGVTTADSTKMITLTSATYSNPAALTVSQATPATWGYALAGVGGFDASYSESTPSPNAKFAGLPLLDSEQLVYSHSGTADNELVDVYYGIKASFSLIPGDYTTTVRYASVADISDQSTGEATSTPYYLPRDYALTSSRITITTSLKTTLNLGNVTATVGGQACTDVQIIKQDPVTFSCQVPAGLAAENAYDIAINISRFNKNYSIPGGLKILSYLQDFTPTKCEALPLETQYEYVDKRDGKAYYVARLKTDRETNGETFCFMTQNLDLDLDSTKTLTPDDTDIPANWKPARSTINMVGNTAPGWADDETHPYSADPGDTYYVSSGDSSNDSIYTSLSGCTSAGHSEETCRHAHAGNYYNFTAAVAMDDSSSYVDNYQNIDQSICPKGWRLPVGMIADNTSSEFARLLYANNIIDTLPTITNFISYADGGFNQLRTAPFFVNRTGYIFENNLFYAANRGYLQTSSVISTSRAYIMNVRADIISLQHTGGRWFGISARCALRGNQYALNFDANGGLDAPDTLEREGLGFVTFSLPTDELPEHDTRQFYGWDEDPNATTPYYVYDHTTQTFSHNGTMTLNAPNFTKTLHAIWHAPVGMGTVTTLQEVTPALCQASPLNQQYRLKDARDDKMYYVAHMKMNREGTVTACWMTQNLDLNLNSSAPALNSSNTDINSDWTPQNNTISFSGTSLTGWTNDNNAPYSADPGDVYYYTSGSGSDDTFYDSLSACVEAGNKTASCRRSHAGNYYNWTAAVAMDDSRSYATNYQAADQSICPSSWRLPLGMIANNTSSESAKLLYANNIIDTLSTNTDFISYADGGFNQLQTAPLFMNRTGYVLGNNLSYAANRGYLQTSSVTSSSGMYIVNIRADFISPQYASTRHFGISVRCVLRGNRYTLNFNARAVQMLLPP